MTSAASQQAVSRLVVLVGFMGAGKTSVGRALAGQLGWSFEDLDDRIEARQNRSIAAIFRDSGEAEFRRVETGALREFLAESGHGPRILAVGGGAFVRTENVELLEQAEVTSVFLDASIEELLRRCEAERLGTTANRDQPRIRPLHSDPKQFGDLYTARRQSYAKAELCVNTDGKDVETIAAEIVRHLELK